MIFIFLVLIFKIYAQDIQIDYTKANINRKQYDQIPNDELIFAKYQATEPLFFPDGALKGRGYNEPIVNEYILASRGKGISTFVDYFTTAKSYFYQEHNYQICVSPVREFRIYKKIFQENKKNNYTFLNKKRLISIPDTFFPGLGKMAISKSKIGLISKHFYKNSKIINIKSLLDDERLKTIQIVGDGSGIRRYIYNNPENPDKILPQYKYRVYEFVASNAIQLTLMLKGKRMDWVDLTTLGGDFYMKQLRFENEMEFFSFSHIDPQFLTKDDLIVNYYSCHGNDLKKLQNQIDIINNTIKKYRTNYPFWEKVLKQYAKDVNIPYVAPEHFFDYQETFKRKKEIDRGDFDLYN